MITRHKNCINRISLSQGDIFLIYDDFKYPNEHTRLHRLLRGGQLITTGRRQESHFIHGGIIVSDKLLIHTTGGESLECEAIEEVLSQQKYYIFRPNNPMVAYGILDITCLLYRTKKIPYPEFYMPTESDSLLKQIKEGVKSVFTSKTARSLFRFSSKSRHVKTLEELCQEFNNMYDLQAPLRTPDIQRIRENIETNSNYDAQKKHDLIESEISRYIRGHVVQDMHIKTFFCTQFVAWVVQVAVGELQKLNLISLGIRDMMNIRDTKATPIRLAQILRKSAEFTEYESIENYNEDDFMAVEEITKIGNPLSLVPIDLGVPIPVRPAPLPPVSVQRVVSVRPAPPPPMSVEKPLMKPVREAPLPPGASPFKRQGAIRRKSPPHFNGNG